MIGREMSVNWKIVSGERWRCGPERSCRLRQQDLRGELARAVSGQDSGLTSPLVMPVPGLVERPDGNNVSADREAMLLAEVQLQFKAATVVLRAEFARLSTAIREGQ